MPADEADGKWLPMHRDKDRPIKMPELFTRLQEAGFGAVDIVHKRMNFALIPRDIDITVAFK